MRLLILLITAFRKVFLNNPAELPYPNEKEWINANRDKGHYIGCACAECEALARSFTSVRLRGRVF